MAYINKYGLINAQIHEDVSENTSLFSLEHTILKKLANEDPSEMEASLIEYFEKLRNPLTTRFNNIPDVSIGHDAYISHDQYTTMCAFSHRHDLTYHKEFWKGIKYGTYDNITGKFNIKRFIHPRDYIYIGYLNDNIWCKLAMPLFCIIIIVSFLTKYKIRPTFLTRLKSGFKLNKVKILKTDGQLLTLVRGYGLKKKSRLFNWTWRLCYWITTRNFREGYKTVVQIYFPSKDHPNHQLSERINNYNLD